ncbi:zinc finger protein 184-like isoform X1 [Cotesia glomerata]|uniref:C2H2-type domain-containing protein n=1 Tax=Cotesia glomerata TaxID=32391 RepID=A0AAV7IVT2_COTGL|nr:zinc finger protein 184-like isoform X1 [Cotesia glomerata]KAH0561307.1 hypothetical protein KQX54_016151 [Cotesia glomerata]
MTTHQVEMENFITGDLTQEGQVSDFVSQKPDDNSIIEQKVSISEMKEEIDCRSEIATQKMDMLKDCMALNRITIRSIQTLNAGDFNLGHRSFQSLVSSTSASTNSTLTTSSDETLLPEESKDEIKMQENLSIKTEKKFFKKEDREDINDNNLNPDPHSGKKLFVVVLNDGTGTAVVQVSDEDAKKHQTNCENSLHEDNDFENLFELDNVKNVCDLKELRKSRFITKKPKDELWKPPARIIKAEKSFKESKESKSFQEQKNYSSKNSCNCKECDREFDYSSAVNLHIRKNTGERFYKCPRCDFASFYLASIKNHIRSHTGAKPFKCYTCRAKFPTSQALLKHKYNCHLLSPKTDNLRCRFCKETFEDKAKWKKHVDSHKVGDFYACSICNYQKKNSSSLESHMNKHANKELFICNECGKSFEQKGLLKEHWGFYHISLLRKKTYKCTMCSYNFVHFECLCRHTKLVHCKTTPKRK